LRSTRKAASITRARASSSGVARCEILFGTTCYDAPFIPKAALSLIGVWLWIKPDITQQLIPRTQAAAVTAGI